MSWMLCGVRFPSTAWFCITGWGTGSKRSSLFFFFFSLLLFLLETKERFRLFFFFFLIEVPIPCPTSPAGLAMPLAVDAGGGSTGVSDLEKPFAGSHAGLEGAFYFARKAQPCSQACQEHSGRSAGCLGDRHLLKKGLA